MVLLLVVTFKASTNLASAYGIAVTGTMLITTLMLAFLIFNVWKWNRLLGGATIALFFVVDSAYFASNITKVPDGGWFPLVVAAVSFTVLTTWAQGPPDPARPAGGSVAAAAGVHQVGGGFGPPDQGHVACSCRRRANSIPSALAPQSQAQPGASRASADPDRASRGRSAC